MKPSELVKAMSEAGAPMEAVLIALKAIEERDDIIEARKAAARERKRKQRAKVCDEGVTVTGQSQDSHEDTPLSLSPNDNNSNPHTHTPDKQTPVRVRADDFPCPDWCKPGVWRDLKRNRRTKSLTNTETAHKRFVAAIEGMADDDWPPGRLVEEITARGWGGPHDPREDRKPNHGRQQNSNSKSGRGAAEIARANLGIA